MITQAQKARVRDNGAAFYVQLNALSESDTVDDTAFYIRKEHIIRLELLKPDADGIEYIKWLTPDGRPQVLGSDSVGSGVEQDDTVVWFTEDGTEEGTPSIQAVFDWIGSKIS